MGLHVSCFGLGEEGSMKVKTKIKAGVVIIIAVA